MSKSRDIADSAATINYIDTVTSNVQDQIDNIDPLPSQSGNSGLFLTTDGTDPSWAEAGGGAWEYISSASSTGSYTVDFTWVGNSGYSAYVIQFIGLTNKRTSGASPSLSGLTMQGATPTAQVGGYSASFGFYNSASLTNSADGMGFPSIMNGNAYNGFLYIFNPESTSIKEKYLAFDTPVFISAAGHTSDTNPITGFRFNLSGGYPGYDGIVGTFKLFGVKAS